MTGGVVVILGETGRNFGAGMSNGVAFIMDERGTLPSRVNPELVGWEKVTEAADIELLTALIRRHRERTGSHRARALLANWAEVLPHFRKVAPKTALSEDGPMTVVRRHLEGHQRCRDPHPAPREGATVPEQALPSLIGSGSMVVSVALGIRPYG
jgi:glutamate synthase domain-containing protein 3